MASYRVLVDGRTHETFRDRTEAIAWAKVAADPAHR
jgi:hypothetical protein